jgi:hypothetical protein
LPLDRAAPTAVQQPDASAPRPNDDFEILCPADKVALSGDAYIGLYSDNAYLRPGAPPVVTASAADNKNDGYYFEFVQPAEDGATQGFVHAQVVCATVADSLSTP